MSLATVVGVLIEVPTMVVSGLYMQEDVPLVSFAKCYILIKCKEFQPGRGDL